jgi:glycine cleavage system aminomethyltransferase T
MAARATAERKTLGHLQWRVAAVSDKCDPVTVSPFYNATVQEGVTAFSPYNSMLMPVSYGNPDAEYERLMNGASQWDVSVQRQVQITGPAAASLVQLLSVRDLSSLEVGKGKYIPMCDHRGILINDPLVLKLEDGAFWLSIGDNNIRMWARAIAAERGLNVEVCEPDVSPMAVQGPKAEEVVAAVFGDWIRALRYFWFAPAEVSGIPVRASLPGS